GHNYGCFVVDGYSAKQISDVRGFWSFIKPPANKDIILAGTYTGLVRIKSVDGKWKFHDFVKGFEESSRIMNLDKTGNLWISHGYRGIFRLQLSSSLDSVTNAHLYFSTNGLPSRLPYNIQVINSEMVITTRSGIMKYNASNDSFELHQELNSIFNGKGFIDKIHQDKNGNLWYFTDSYIGLMRLLEDGTYIDITAPFSEINDILLPAFQNIYIHDQYNVLIGSQKGLIHYSPSIKKDYLIADEVFIKEAIFYGKLKNQISYFSPYAEISPSEKLRIIPYSKNSVSFKYTSPSYENPEKNSYSYRLIGFDDIWSDWDKINFKEYTNLREGNYTFQIKSLNSFNAESNIKSFHFTIKPPFLRSQGAYISYLIIFILVIIGNVYYIRKRILAARLREKIKQEKRFAQREKMFKEQSALSEKEIIQLRNESLRNEMKFKNKELANATLHLIQKNRTLTNLKEDLGKLLKNIPSESHHKQSVNNLIKKINKDLRNEKNWELFNSYFDEVHQDFISKLKSQHKDLTPKELRLCAYLRMNISTKEIAPLMNISVRGVEISRYRLRKKLKLDHDKNLTEFILSF
ncbi:MAG TPA: triple tyrosine motif-containing protein, partial [Tenuifilaceae bacterium]|nr:triple tyrosine motif-containing protein [Tenuifilaceae bacterium]